jgi:hypothetical protein
MSSKYDHEPEQHDPKEGFDPTEPAARQITGFVIGSVITLVVVIAALNIYFNSVWEESVYDKVLAAPGLEVRDQRNLEAWRMEHYEYATPAKDTVRIPFDRAKELFLADQAQGKTFYKAQPTVPKPEEPAGTAPAGADAAKGQEGKQAEAGKQ